MDFDNLIVSVYLMTIIAACALICWYAVFKSQVERMRNGICIFPGDRWSPFAWRFCSSLGVLVSLGISYLVWYSGYQWWFGFISVATICIGSMSLGYYSAAPSNFRATISTYSIAHFPLAIALILGWADYFHWINLPANLCYVLCIASASVFAYATVRSL